MTVESVYSVYVFIYRNLLIGPNPRCTPHSVTFTQDMSIDSVRGEGGVACNTSWHGCSSCTRNGRGGRVFPPEEVENKAFNDRFKWVGKGTSSGT